MTLGERLDIILSERKIKQVQFAGALGVSANYVNQLVNGKKVNISDTLAMLIEETYGYSAQWVLTGDGEKYATPSLSVAKASFIKRVKKMPDDEVIALLAFADSFDKIKKALNLEEDLK